MSKTSRPLMRQQGLVVDDLPDEVLVYDLDRHQAHCLNRTAAIVWRLCDGQSTPAEIARHLQRELDAPGTEDLVWMALRQLDKLHLLERAASLPPRFAGMSRREMIRNLGIAAAVTLPVVTSIVAPTPVQAATCRHNNASCTTANDCCSGVCDGSGHCVGG
jgi:hypothetical protein